MLPSGILKEYDGCNQGHWLMCIVLAIWHTCMKAGHDIHLRYTLLRDLEAANACSYRMNWAPLGAKYYGANCTAISKSYAICNDGCLLPLRFSWFFGKRPAVSVVQSAYNKMDNPLSRVALT